MTCYRFIKSNPGNITKGSTTETLDGINNEWFYKTGKDLLEGRYQFKPARQVMIPKANSDKMRPLSIGSPRDKIVQKAIQVVLSAIYEHEFIDVSHGFRPDKSTVTALNVLHQRGGPYSWVIQGDITKCFDTIPHQVIMEALKERITCSRTLVMIERALRIGIVDEHKRHIKSTVGTPQGSIISPILSNIVLHKLDVFIEENLKPKYTSGVTRRDNKEYVRLSNYRRESMKHLYSEEKRREILQRMRNMPAKDPFDPNFSRLLYVRYADDFVVLVIGPKTLAVQIRTEIEVFLAEECGIQLNIKKTLVTSTREGFHFLGAFCHKRTNVGIYNKSKNNIRRTISRRSTLRLGVDAPILVLIDNLVKYGFARRNHLGKVLAKGLTHMIHLDHEDIIRFFNSKMLGILSYYEFAGNRSSLHSIMWIFRQSCALTLARKLKLRTMRKAFGKFGYNLKNPKTDSQLNAPTSLIRLSNFRIPGKVVEPGAIELLLDNKWSNKLTQSIASECVLCGSSYKVEMHHLRRVKDVWQNIRTGNVTYAQWIGGSLRKQIPLCKYHHQLYHQGKLNTADITRISKYSSNMK
jgi:group II intron reverse transcriptase/maturase